MFHVAAEQGVHAQPIEVAGRHLGAIAVRLGELAGEGRIAGRAPIHLGFMGHIDGPLVDRLVKGTAPQAAGRLIAAGTDCVLLTPA